MEVISDRVGVAFHDKKIIHNINIEIKNKSFVGIIGPNGSGKSTFLKCIYRVLKPQEGAVYLDGRNIQNLSYQTSALNLAVVAQGHSCSFDFEVLEMVLMGRSPHKNFLEPDNEGDYKIAYQALKTVGLEDFAKRKFSSLSGGEQQRVILARALAQQTNCLILDEPTNHLDIKFQLQLMNVVRNLKVTVIAAIHDLNIAAMYCDKLYALKDGQILGHGSPLELLTTQFIYDLYGVRASSHKRTDSDKLFIVYHNQDMDSIGNPDESS